ncbi:MAG TPA: sialidase family protein, partial [Acidimicrobiales bacterium]|nr:sialidase family protein [Acidimicrobiales bacterium]
MRFRSVFLVAVVLPLMSAAILVPASADVTPDVGAEARISRTPVIARTFEGPTSAIDPRDPDKIFVAAADLLANRCHVFRSGDGGETFRQLDGPDFGRLTDCGLNKGGIPQNIRMKLAFDPEGVLYWVVAVADPAAQGSRSVVLARSTDDGRTWAVTPVAEGPSAASPEEAVANFVPDLFVDPFGTAPRTVWVSWRRSFTEASERTTEGWAARSTDGGATFEPELRAIGKNPGFDAPRVLQDNQGTVYWFQRERPPSGAEGEPAKPSSLLMARSDDGGRTWVPGELGQADVVMEEPLAGVSPRGDALYVAWADGRNGDLDLFFIRSGDGGRSWSRPVRVNDDRLRNRRSQKW